MFAAYPTTATAATPTTLTFREGANQVFDVPTGVTQVTITAVGGKGGDYYGVGNDGPGGYAAKATRTVTVTPGQDLFVNVPGPAGHHVYGGGAGGGASDVRTSTTAALTGDPNTDPRLIVAGGGGGGGNVQGGNAGQNGQDHWVAVGGGAGTATSGGAAGQSHGGGTTHGTQGWAGVGGGGGDDYGEIYAGAGGDGWFGGGGGGVSSDQGSYNGAAGGGGGSSYAPGGSVATDTTGQAVVRISYSVPHAHYYNHRTSSGWQTYYSGDGFSGDYESIAAMPNGSVHYLAQKSSDGSFYHKIRSGNTTSAWAKLNGYNGAPSFSGYGLAIAGMPDGSLQVVGIGLDGRIYHRIRNSDNLTWTPWAPMQGRPGEATFPARKVAIAGMGDGSAQVFAYSSDNNGLYTSTRNAAGTAWTAWSQVDNPGGDGGVGFGADLAVAAGANGLAMPNNSSQLLAIGTDGKVYHNLRTPTGPGGAPVYSGWGALNISATSVAITGMPDGKSQTLLVDETNRLQFNIRNMNGSWTGFSPVSSIANVPVHHASIAGIPTDNTTRITFTTS